MPSGSGAFEAMTCSAPSGPFGIQRISVPSGFFLVVPHRRTADPRCVKLCYSVCALSAQRSVFSLVREARLVVGPGALEHP
jgi:hypothetical protein